MDSQKTTAKFYDDFSYKQVKTGKNLRHYTIAKNLKNKGISKSNKILEIGCGIGTLTDILQHIAPNAEISALDISPKNIEIARSRFKSKRIRLMVADASENLTINEKFDYIILADVIEHIPIERYHLLFSNLNRLSHSNTKIFINIPHPNLIKYLRETNPESLQIVDQSIYSTILYDHLCSNKFIIEEKKDYSIFYQTPDYSYYWISPLQEDININYNKTVPLPFRIIKKLLLRVF
ncbi:MAG: class I SAM-dependent methyltransferase [Bacteroidota bacterium]